MYYIVSYIITIYKVSSLKDAAVYGIDSLQVIALRLCRPHNNIVRILLIDEYVLEFRRIELNLKRLVRESVLHIAYSVKEVRVDWSLSRFLWHIAGLINGCIPHTHKDIISVLKSSKGQGTSTIVVSLLGRYMLMYLYVWCLKGHPNSVLP